MRKFSLTCLALTLFTPFLCYAQEQVSSICLPTGGCLTGTSAAVIQGAGIAVMLATLIINYFLGGKTDSFIGKILSFIAEMKIKKDGFAPLAIVAVMLMGGVAGMFIQAQHEVVNDHSKDKAEQVAE